MRNKAMIHYTNQDVKCRMQVLQEYFGEVVNKPCGKCDICLRKVQSYSTKIYSEIREIILLELHSNPFKPDDISTKFKGRNEKAIKETIKLMLDSGELYFDEVGFLKVFDMKNI